MPTIRSVKRMASKPTERAAARVPLNRERVLEAAVAIADRDGIAALSMRRLGRELGVEAMSLYNHVAGKEDLERGIVEVVLAEIESPRPGRDWKTEIRSTAVSSHDAFVRHRWSCSLLTQGSGVSRVRMEWMEAVLATFRKAGFSPNLTHHAYHAIDSHITGFTLWQVGMPFRTREELVDLAAGFLRRIPADEFPYIVEHAKEHVAPPDATEKPEFEFGLDLILDGLERLRDAE
jgi:AcrR family transcriptional regulator